MTPITEYEYQLRLHDRKRWRQYLNEREGFIAHVVTEHAERGKRITRKQAVLWWQEKQERKLAQLNDL